MSPLLAFVYCCVSYWIGVAVTERQHRREANSIPVASWRNFSEKMRRAMIEVRDLRKFTGPGPVVTQTTCWQLDGVGKFRVTIEDTEPATIEGTTAA